MREIIINKIQQKLNPISFDVIDESHLHYGHSGHRYGEQTHFNIFIISKMFENCSRIERERLIHKVLADELKSKIHAIKLKLITPNEWNKNVQI